MKRCWIVLVVAVGLVLWQDRPAQAKGGFGFTLGLRLTGDFSWVKWCDNPCKPATPWPQMGYPPVGWTPAATGVPGYPNYSVPYAGYPQAAYPQPDGKPAIQPAPVDSAPLPAQKPPVTNEPPLAPGGNGVIFQVYPFKG